jgi:hypothetical protein
MSITLNDYDLLENLIIESLLVNKKDKKFFKNKNNLDLLYENFLEYSNLKLIRLKDIKENYKNYAILTNSSIIAESKTLKEIKIIQEGIWDSIKDVASSAYEKVKSGVSSVLDYAQKSPAELMQSIADVVSVFDPTGLVDLINGSVYFARGEISSAFFSFVGAAMVLPGFISSLTVAGAAVGVPMIAAGKALKGILKFGGKIGAPILNFAAKALKTGGVVEKLLSVGAKIPGLGKFLEFIKGAIPKFTKAAEEGGSVSEILSKVFGGAGGDVIKAAGNAGENLVNKGTQIATKGAEKAASKTGANAAEAVAKYSTPTSASNFQKLQAVGSVASTVAGNASQPQQQNQNVATNYQEEADEGPEEEYYQPNYGTA